MTKAWREDKIPQEVWKEIMEALGDSTVAGLPTRIRDIKRSTF